jgi:lambda family phage portal protein
MSYDEEFIRHMATALRDRSREAYLKKAQNYAAGGMTRLTADWPTQITSPTAILRSTLTAMRSRSRNLVINNDYARRFIFMVGVNIGGPDGIILQCKAKWPDGRLDKWANDKIENAWNDWGRKGNFDVTGQLSMVETDRLGPQAVAQDGEIIIRIIEDFDNPWGFALQFYEVDHLDESLNIARLPNGNSLRMGVEFDKWFRPVAYHLLTDHPGDSFWTYNRRNYLRVPAENIIHPFVRERFNQPRGVPWMHSAMTRLNNIGAYEEAAIIAARIGASKMGNYELDEDADPALAQQAAGVDEKTAQGELLSDIAPGMVGFSPRGYKFNPIDWKYPDGEFAPFMKASLRGISSGLLVSYNSLASDLEGVNYSSIRAGVLEERDCWKLQQAWWVENYKRPIYLRWLRWCMLSGKLSFSFGTIEKYQQVKWQPRTWPWVDPEKDNNAKVVALKNKLTSWTKALAEDGIDLEEHLAELQAEQELAKKYNVELTTEEPKTAQTKKPAGTDEEDDEEEDENKPGTTRKKPGPMNFNLTVNGAPVQVTSPEVKNEITVQPAAPAQVTVPVENKIDVQPSPAPQVTVPVENKIDVQPAAPAQVTIPVENKIDVQPAAPAQVMIPVENKIDVQPAPAPQVTVNTPEVKNEIRMPRPERRKRKSVMKDADGRVLRTVEEE